MAEEDKKVEAPKVEAPKVEAPKVESPKVETPEAPKGGSNFSYGHVPDAEVDKAKERAAALRAKEDAQRTKDPNTVVVRDASEKVGGNNFGYGVVDS